MVWETRPGASLSKSPPPADEHVMLGPNVPHDYHVCTQIHISNQCPPPVGEHAVLGPNVPPQLRHSTRQSTSTANANCPLTIKTARIC